MKWEEFKKGQNAIRNEKLVETEIECPKCGEYLWRRIDMVLTTYPVQYGYECKSCGFHGWA